MHHGKSMFLLKEDFDKVILKIRYLRIILHRQESFSAMAVISIVSLYWFATN